MICSKCGKEVKPTDVEYCPDCGMCYCKNCRENDHGGICEVCFGNLKYFS